MPGRWLDAIVDACARRPLRVLVLALVCMALMWGYASRIELRSDLMELLPRDSPAFRAYEHQLGRAGGGASLIVVAESRDPAANERFVDDLAARVREASERRRARGLPDPIAYVESDAKELRQFFRANRWLYASLSDLEDVDRRLELEVGERSGMVEDLEHEPNREHAAGSGDGALAGYEKKWEEAASRFDETKSGYFATADGTTIALRIVSTSSATGDAAGAELLRRIQDDVRALVPARYEPSMSIGYAGDIPNALEEKQSLVGDALLATAIAFVLICGGVVLFFRSAWSLVVIVLPALFGVGAAYAFATAVFGYVNTTGAFLGAIILGNGINYPIVLLARYREFRRRGQAAAEARRDAVRNAFRAELVGASVASIAYGSLVITQFRGFSQFGVIGFVGMILVWASSIVLVPTLVSLVDLIDGQVRRDISPMHLIARVTRDHAVPLVFAALGLSVIAGAQLPRYLSDPWEYDFSKLGSVAAKSSGAGSWSNKADRAFGGKMNVAGALMLADTPDQVPLLAQQIRANDRRDPSGPLVAAVTTLFDFLPGTPSEQEAKLAVLTRIRKRLTPRALAELTAEERANAIRMRPPDDLRPVAPADLPEMLRVRFRERNGTLGTVFYVKYDNSLSLSDGRNLLRIAKTTDNVALPDGTVVRTASRATVFAEIIRSLERDGPLATFAAFACVTVVVLIATRSRFGAMVVLLALSMAVIWMLGLAALLDRKLNFLNFIALPITFGIGCEYPFNVYDRSRLLGGDVSAALRRAGGAVALCSYTTIIGYGSLLFADNQALQSFGWLAMTGEAACLVAALFVVPSLLHIFACRRRGSLASPQSRQPTRAKYF